MKYTFYAVRLFFEVLPFRESRVVPTHVGAPGRLIIWSRLNPMLLKFLRHRTGLERAQTANNFRRNSFACGNLIFLAAHFGVSQWSLSAQGSCLASPPLCPPPNRCNAMGTILNSHPPPNRCNAMGTILNSHPPPNRCNAMGTILNSHPPPNRCNAMGTILNSQNNEQWHKTRALYAKSHYAMCTYTPLLNMQATSKSTTWNDYILLFPVSVLCTDRTAINTDTSDSIRITYNTECFRNH